MVKHQLNGGTFIYSFHNYVIAVVHPINVHL